MFCSNCGKEIASSGSFCSGCGVNVAEQPKSPTSIKTAPKPVVVMSRLKRFVIIIGAIAAGGVVMFAESEFRIPNKFLGEWHHPSGAYIKISRWSAEVNDNRRTVRASLPKVKCENIKNSTFGLCTLTVGRYETTFEEGAFGNLVVRPRFVVSENQTSTYIKKE